MNIDFPFHIDHRGRTAQAGYEKHIRDLIEQVLFTSPGERVNRPTFGSPLKQLIFAPANTELAATTQFLVQGALQQWLGDLIRVDEVQVQSVDASIKVLVRYTLLLTGQQHQARFEREV